MLRLLREIPGSGYPADYLLPRLRGRRGSAGAAPAIPRGGTVPVGDSPFWEQAARERSWLFRQLDFELRATLAPLFVYFEVGTLVQVLRYLAGNRAESVDGILETSMLSPMIRVILRGRDGVADVLSRLERSLAGEVLALAGIGASFAEGGLRRCEELLRARFLARVLASGGQDDLTLFFQALVDGRNILAVAKALRWRPDPMPALLPGGSLPLPRPGRRCSADELARMVRRFSHGLNLADEQLRPEQLEPLLQAQLLQKLVRRRRAGGAVSSCIEYVWRGQVAARQRSLRLHTAAEAVS